MLVPKPTQPSIPPGSVNEDQLWLGRQLFASASEATATRRFTNFVLLLLLLLLTLAVKAKAGMVHSTRG